MNKNINVRDYIPGLLAVHAHNFTVIMGDVRLRTVVLSFCDLKTPKWHNEVITFKTYPQHSGSSASAFRQNVVKPSLFTLFRNLLHGLEIAVSVYNRAFKIGIPDWKLVIILLFIRYSVNGTSFTVSVRNCSSNIARGHCFLSVPVQPTKAGILSLEPCRSGMFRVTSGSGCKKEITVQKHKGRYW